jgi:hypothetical protein
VPGGTSGEEAWVRANISDQYRRVEKVDRTNAGSCVSAARSALVVLVKAGQTWKVYTNVTAGQTICSCGTSGWCFAGCQQDVSHDSYFDCVEE